MISKNTQPNAEERRWLKAVADFHNDQSVSYLYGDEWGCVPFQIHHVAGRAYKQNKVHIGHWFILPVPHMLHDVHSNHNLNVTHHRHAFTEYFGLQRYLWRKMVDSMIEQGRPGPPIEVVNSVMLTKY